MDKFKWTMVFNPLYWVAAFLFVGRQTRKRTYNGLFPGLITIPLGFVFSVIALIATKHVVGEQLGLGWYAWLPAALVASSLVGSHVWPIAYSISDIIGDFLGHVTKALAEWILGPIVAGIRSIPGVSWLWSNLEGEKGKSDRKWFTSFLFFATYAVGTLACGYVGYLTTEWVHGLLADTVFGSGWLYFVFADAWIIAGFAGVVVARLLWQPLHDTLDKAEVNGLAFIWSTIVGYYGYTLLGTTLISSILWGLGAFALNTAIAFPLVLLFFNEGLKKVGELLEPVLKATYRGDRNDFRLGFHHIVNILLSLGLTSGAYILGNLLDWNIWLTAGFSVVTLVASYLSVVHVIKHSGGNAMVGFFSSVALGFFAFDLYGTHLGWLGWLGGVIAAVLAAALWGLALLPLIYRGLELAVGPNSTFGAWLDKRHERASEEVKKLYEKGFKKAQEATFHDKTEFKPLFGQISNVLFAGAVFYFSYVYGLPHAGEGWLYWLALVGAGLVTFTSYLVGGKLAKNAGGEPLIVLLCVGAALWVGGNAFSLLPWAWYWALPAAVVLALVAGYVLGLFVIPPIYALLKYLVLLIPDDQTGAKKGWKSGISTFFLLIHTAIYDVVDAWILKPLESAVEAVAKVLGPMIAAVSKAYNDLMARFDRIFKKKGA